LSSRALVTGLFLLAALVNLAPVVGLVLPSRIAGAYGVAVEGPDLLILLRHRAGIVGALLAAAALRPRLRTLATCVGLFSMLSFAVVVWLDGPANAALRRVAAVDVVASLALAAAWWLDRRPGAVASRRPAPAAPPSRYAVRQLGPGDAPRLETLATVFGEAFDDPGSYTASRPDPAYHRRLLGGDCFIALVAEADGEIVGGIAAYELPKLERERSEIYLYDLAVASPHRRRGVATALIRKLEEIAAERGAQVVFVQADAGDEPAIALYSRLGAREDVHHFDLPVGASRARES